MNRSPSNSRLPEALIGEQLTTSGLTLATAESCSGGLLAHRITNVPGSSGYFLGGVITYSNEAKADLLGVSMRDLDQDGAVSETVARQMAQGVRERFDADWGVGITGIAGPGGGSPGKPVGLVYIALSGGRQTSVTRNLFEGSRESIKEQTTEEALRLLLEQLQ
ncbi:MAG: CinA family protein [Candidatus Hydrogenedentes bacterium]|nr:CinA family protein [Candidatus Hydrogenedentota bacterium]